MFSKIPYPCFNVTSRTLSMSGDIRTTFSGVIWMPVGTGWRPVRPAMARGLLGPELDPGGPEAHVQQARIPGFMTAQIATVMPWVRNAVEQGIDLLPERGKVVSAESVKKVFSGCRDFLTMTCQVPGQPHVEAALHLEVRVVQMVQDAGATPFPFRDGQVPGLEPVFPEFALVEQVRNVAGL